MIEHLHSVNNFDLDGGRLLHENPFISPILWQRAEAILIREILKPKKSDELSYEEQILLAEVFLLAPSLKVYGIDNIPEEVLRYVNFNEKTAMLEAITSGVISQTVRVWSPETHDCLAYGYPTIPMYKAGIKEAKKLAEQKPKSAFEVRRREVELADAVILNKAIEQGILDSHYKITISPYPDDADEETATNLGYYSETHAAMIRIFDYNPQDKKVITTQIRVSSSNVEAFSDLLHKLANTDKSIVVPITDDVSPPTKILATQIYIPKDQLPKGVIDLAQLYDDALEKIYHNPSYLGVLNAEQKYEELWNKTRSTENDLQGLVQEIMRIDIEIAQSLNDGEPTLPTQNLLQEALQLSETSLDYGSRQILQDALDNKFTLKAAAVLKKLQLIKTWGIAATLVNQEHAEKLFGEETSIYIREAYLNNTDHRRDDLYLMETIAGVKPTFSMCGASIGQKGNRNLLNSPLSGIQETFFGSGEGKYVKKCGNCGVSIEAKIAKGYRCHKCGGTYQGC